MRAVLGTPPTLALSSFDRDHPIRGKNSSPEFRAGQTG